VVEQFGAGATYHYRLHPPVLRALGMQRKVSLGRWFRPVFRLLVTMRRVRGTSLDPFGRAEVRRVERALIGEYLDTIGQLLTDLTVDNHGLAVEIAELPDLIRGYEHVKLRNVAIYRHRTTEQLQRFHRVRQEQDNPTAS
jgi:indolepyruvate ferredoxin oxidoreductase